MRTIALKFALGAVLLGGWWLIYSLVVPFVFQRSLRSLAVPHVAAPQVPRDSASAVTLARIFSPSDAVGPSAEALAEEKRSLVKAAADLQKRKDQAWAAEQATEQNTAGVVLDNRSMGGGHR